MSSARTPSQKPAPLRAIGRAVDWRLVAAVGLPLWAFLIGIVVSHRPAPAAARPVEVTAVAAATEPPAAPATPPVEPIPAPREVVVRTEVVPVPLVVPLLGSEPAAAEPAAPPEFQLPPSEVTPGDRCQTFETRVRFHAGLPEAAEEAKQSKKMLLVLHISGNFDDPGFT